MTENLSHLTAPDTPLAIIGLGYVGLPLAVEFGRHRPVVGFDINAGRIAELQAGHDSTLEVEPPQLAEAIQLQFSSHAADLKACQVFIVTVPTPVDQANRPDLTPLIKASETVGKALKPGDVVRASNGKTIEVINTDAEGRLVLADAIVRALEDEPDYLIDTATLTGAQMVALGTRTPGVMGTRDFRNRVAELSRAAGENGWAMPMPTELRADLSSRVADMANVTPHRNGGMLAAAIYLKEFVPTGQAWAHLDIAGPAFNSGGPWGYSPKGGTGVPVRTLIAVIEDIAATG